MRPLVFAFATMLAASSALAYPQETDLLRSSDLEATGLTPPKLLEGVACNAAEAARTFTATADRGQGYAVGAFQLDFTRNAATLLTIQLQGSLNGQTSWASIPGCDDTTDGICALTGTGLFTRDVSGGSENLIFRADFLGSPDIKVVITCTAGGASDTFDLYGRITSQ